MNNNITTGIETSSEIEKYASLLDSYGVAITILAIFIFIFMIVFVCLLRNNAKTTKQLMDQQQTLLDKIMDEDENTHPKKEKNLVELFVEINNSTKDILRKINEQIDASRLSIYVFHNGSYSSHGLPFFKVSCIAEIVKKNCGITNKVKDHTSLPLSMFNNCIEDLFNDGKVVILDVATTETTYPVLFNILKNQAKSACGVAVYDNDNNIVGVVIAEFKDKKDNLDSIINTLMEYAPFLQPVLAYSKK
jgi:hypothetical protein